MAQVGQIRVGRCIDQQLKKITPHYDNFEKIIVMTKSSKYGSIGPYELKNDKGEIMENIYQFSKIYKWVPKTVAYYSRYDRTVIWDYPKEIHIGEDGYILDKYYEWRETGFANKHAVRYPVGMKHRSNCIGAIKDIDNDETEIRLLNYVDSRKQIYLPVYCELVEKQPLFKKLKEKLNKGINLLIIEVDGPHEEDLDYYKEKYNCGDDFIVNHTMLATEQNLKIMLNDTKRAFGHGYCLASALLDLDEIITDN